MNVKRCQMVSCLLAAGVVLSLLALAGPAAARNPNLSNWTINLSGDEPVGETWDDAFQEILVVGSTVHVLWWSRGNTISDRLYYRRSTDGGQTWQAKILLFDTAPDGGNREISGQKYMAVDGASVHVAYWANPSGVGHRLFYRRSTNNGVSFEAARLLAPDSGGYTVLETIHVAAVPGKVTIACRINNQIVTFNSPDGGSNFTGTVVAGSGGGADYRWNILVGDLKRVGERIHLIYTQELQLPEANNWSNALFCTTSQDGGAHWSVPIRMTTQAANGKYLTYVVQDQNYSPNLAVDGNNVFVVWTQNDTDYESIDHSLYFRRSGDQGANFGAATKLAQNQTGGIGDLQSGTETVALKGNYVYVEFMTSDGTVYLRRSSDSGAGFSPLQTLGTGAWWPNLVVDQANGAKVHVFWSSTYRYSADGGATFTNPVVLMPWAGGGVEHSGAQMALGPNATKHLVNSLKYYTPAYGWGDEDIFYRRYGPVPAPSGMNKALKTYSDAAEARFDCMEVAYSDWFNFSSRMSAEVWVKPMPTADIYWRPIFAKLSTDITPSGSQELFSLGTDAQGWVGPHAVANLGTTDGWYVLNLGWSDPVGTVPANEWTHLAMTYDSEAPGNNFKLYKNGQLINSTRATGNVATGSGNFYAGNFWPGRNGGWEMDELRLWSKALTQSEINDNMRRKLAGNEVSLNAYYQFDATTKDMTGHGNDGILIYQESFVASLFATSSAAAINTLLLMD